MFKPLCIMAALCLPFSAALADDDLKPYPVPEAGQKRVVIRLPEVAQPDEHKVEILFGKRLSVDCNRHSIGARVSSRIAKGWGYPYLVLEKLGPPIATRMACPPEQARREELVPIRSQYPDTTWLRYNAKLPVVVYVPEEVEVTYRIWSAGEIFQPQ